MHLSQEQGGIAPQMIPEGRGLNGTISDRGQEPAEAPLSGGTLALGTGEQVVGQAAHATTPLRDRLGSMLRNSAGWLFGLWLVGAATASLRFGLARRRLHISLRHRRDVFHDTLTTACAHCRPSPASKTCSAASPTSPPAR